MKNFPIMKSTEFAFLCAEVNTGHVLDVDFKVSIDDTQEVYIVCDTYQDALNKIDILSSQKKGVEFVIFDSEKKMIKYIAP